MVSPSLYHGQPPLKPLLTMVNPYSTTSTSNGQSLPPLSPGVLDLNGAEEDGGLELESVVLHEFSFSGLLSEVEISLSAYDAKGKNKMASHNYTSINIPFQRTLQYNS